MQRDSSAIDFALPSAAERLLLELFSGVLDGVMTELAVLVSPLVLVDAHAPAILGVPSPNSLSAVSASDISGD